MGEYKYKILEEVITSIAQDSSDENIKEQIGRLTSDEIRKLRSIMVFVESTLIDREYDELFGEC